MDKKFLAVVLSVLGMMVNKAEAQGVVFVTQDTGMPVMQGYNVYPEVLIHVPPMNQDNVVFQNSAFAGSSVPSLQNPATAIQNVANNENKDVNYYIQRLSLSPEQVNKAQEISNNSYSKQQQLLQSIETLKDQVKELENNALRDFEAILTEDQRGEFNRLRNEAEATAQVEAQSEQPQEVYVEPQPEPQPEQPQEVYVEPQPEPQPEQPQEVYVEPQPEPQPEQPQEVYVEPQPEPQSEQPQEVYVEPQPEPQPEQPQEVYVEPQPENVQ